jgi:glycosyltransferase involved in cell wall biosynthesis
MNPAEICILSSNHIALDHRIFDLEASSLRGAGHRVTMIALHPKEEEVRGIRIIPWASTVTRGKRLRGLLRIFRMARSQRADVYHLQDLELLPVGILLKVFTRAKVIYDVHENFRLVALGRPWIPRVLRWPLSLLVDVGERLLARGMDAVIMAHDMSRRFAGSRRVLVRNLPRVLEMDTSSHREPPKNPREYTLIYVGHLTRIRGIFELVECARRVSQRLPIKLMLVGSSREIDLEELVKGDRDIIEYLGWKNRDEINRLFREAHIGLMLLHPTPAYLSVVPNKIYEYMSAGLPIVASDFGPVRRLLDEVGAGLTVNPFDPEESSNAVCRILEDPSLWKEMSGNGREASRVEFNWEKEEGTLLSLYRDILK